jgi:uncharacterized protein (DUF952 family)
VHENCQIAAFLCKDQMANMIFKILTAPQWETLQATHSFAGSADDKRDGFVHLSKGAQVQGTLDKHYSYAKTGGDNLVLAAFDPDMLGDALKYERSRGGDDFPHLYAPLPLSALTNHWVLQLTDSNQYTAPELITDMTT